MRRLITLVTLFYTLSPAFSNGVSFYSGTVSSPSSPYSYQLLGTTILENIYSSINTTGIFAVGALTLLVAATGLFIAKASSPKPHEEFHYGALDYRQDYGGKGTHNRKDVFENSPSKAAEITFSYGDPIYSSSKVASSSFVPIRPSSHSDIKSSIFEPKPPITLNYDVHGYEIKNTDVDSRSRRTYHGETQPTATSQRKEDMSEEILFQSKPNLEIPRKRIYMKLDGNDISQQSLVQRLKKLLVEAVGSANLQADNADEDHDNEIQKDAVPLGQYIPYLSSNNSLGNYKKEFKTESYYQGPYYHPQLNGNRHNDLM